MDLDTFRSRYQQKTLTVNDRNWGVIDSGGGDTKPAFVFLPGTLGTAEIFWNQIVALSDTHRVLSLTYPPVADAEALVDDIADLLGELDIRTATILGSSLGGFLAQLFAIRHPERIDHVFIANSLSDPSPFKSQQPPPWQILAMPVSALRKVMGDRIRSWSANDERLAPLVELLLHQLNKGIPGRSLKARVLTLLKSDNLPLLPIPDSRITIIDSDDDPLIPETARAEVRRRYPGARHCRFKYGGHFPYVVRPDDYTAQIRANLEEVAA
jgi:pimeloyl-ACP methyl ester carboxylesterase